MPTTLHKRMAKPGTDKERDRKNRASNLDLVRKAGPYEILTHLFHDLGIQSNILVSARYAHRESAKLTQSKISVALLDVIHEHPALCLIDVAQPSEKKAGNHRLWEARLPRIVFENCVEFIDEEVNDDGLSRIFKRAHNQWFDTADHSKPWWKLVVVNGSYVIFVYHHSIGDGLSGYAFHRSLLAALNSYEVKAVEISTDVPVSIFESFSPRNPSPYPLDEIDDKLYWPHVIYTFIFWNIIRFFVSERYFLFSDAVFPKTYPTITKPLPDKERTVTNVEILRIDKEIMAKCVSACRKHNTSFTALLHTLIQIALASDIYPMAKLAFSRQAVNIRSFLRTDPGKDVFLNAAGQYGRVQWLGEYRKAGATETTGQSSSPVVPLNPALAWELAAEYKKGMDHSITSRAVIQDFLTGKLLGEDVEDVGSFYGLGLYQNNSFLISNLGVFEPREVKIDGGWRIEEVGFSAGAIRAAVGDIGMNFNVASTKGGDCVISTTHENGVLRDEMVRGVLEKVYLWMEVLS